MINNYEEDYKEKTNKQYEQSDQEKKLAKKVEKLFQLAKSHRQKYDQKWPEYYNYFRGKQWPEERPPYRHSEVINIIFSTIQGQVPILTDNRPKFEFEAQEPSDIEFSTILNQMAQHDWDRFNWLMEITEIIFDSHIYGTGFSTTPWSGELDYGLGAVEFESLDPTWVYPDPEAKDCNKKAEYFIIARPMSIDKIKKKWPSKGVYVKADIDADFFDKTELEPTKLQYPTDYGYTYETARPDINEDKKALLIVAYFKDDEIEEEEVKKMVEAQDEAGNIYQKEEIVYNKKKKYPHGRRVVMANKVILKDEKNPYEDGEWPYERLVNYILPREFWGISEVEQLQGPQNMFNKIISFALDVLTLMGNPIWIIDLGSEVDTENLYNQPGAIVEKARGSEVRRESGVQLQPYVFQLIDRIKSYVDDISGATDVSRGVTPTGVKAAKAITALQDAAYTRLRQKSRNLDAYLQDFGRHYKSRVLQFYSAPRVVRLTNNEGAAQYFRFQIETKKDEKGNETKLAKIQNFMHNGENGLISEEEKIIELNGDFDVKVNTGSLLPFNKAIKEEKLLAYFDRGLIDDEEVLKNTDEFQNYKTILQRKADKQAQMAQQQQV